MNNILIIAPHADDEILGCGGMIDKFSSNGHKIFVAIMTNANKGDPQRFSLNYIKSLREEALKSHKYLKIKKTFFFDFAAPNLDQVPIAKISDKIYELLKIVKPSKTFIPHFGDSHHDHLIIHKASMVALRPNSNTSKSDIYSYETLSETEWGLKNYHSTFIPNYYVKLNKKNLNKKVKAFQIYKSQNKKAPHPRSKDNIINLAKLRGSNICEDFAEAFNIIRIIK